MINPVEQFDRKKIQDIIRFAEFEEFYVFRRENNITLYEIIFKSEGRYWKVRVTDKLEDACYPATGMIWGKEVVREWKFKDVYVERKV
jgi:hypothetical protein